MSTSRRFLLASSLARLIQTERGGQRIVEGYFPEREGRCSCVRLDGRAGSLILITHGSNGPVEEPTEIPPAHAEVLLAATMSEIVYFRTSLFLGADAHVSRFSVPGPLDLVDVTFDHELEAREFQPPVWFGPEVGADPRFRNQSLAHTGLVPVPELPLTDEALNILLDTLENRRSPQHRTWLKDRAAS